jgi:MraZ protein
MEPFFGLYPSKIDLKGRVSVPAPFRKILQANSAGGKDQPTAPLVLRPSHTHPCIEVWTEEGFANLSATLTAYEPLSDEYDDLALGLFADVAQMETDKEGRIVIPDHMREHAQIKDSLLFMGRQTIFQIWEPVAGNRRIAEARAKMRPLVQRGGGQA